LAPAKLKELGFATGDIHKVREGNVLNLAILNDPKLPQQFTEKYHHFNPAATRHLEQLAEHPSRIDHNTSRVARTPGSPRATAGTDLHPFDPKDHVAGKLNAEVLQAAPHGVLVQPGLTPAAGHPDTPVEAAQPTVPQRPRVVGAADSHVISQEDADKTGRLIN
jgi:hypothetical protein